MLARNSRNELGQDKHKTGGQSDETTELAVARQFSSQNNVGIALPPPLLTSSSIKIWLRHSEGAR